jgi:hypothetical protein
MVKRVYFNKIMDLYEKFTLTTATGECTVVTQDLDVCDLII